MRSKVGECRLRNLREKRGWTQDDLSKRTDIGSNSISEYENDVHEMMLGTARTFAKALGCLIDDLYEWDD
jgi:transcriptional regulator with XRE-family HTH domain